MGVCLQKPGQVFDPSAVLAYIKDFQKTIDLEKQVSIRRSLPPISWVQHLTLITFFDELTGHVMDIGVASIGLA